MNHCVHFWPQRASLCALWVLCGGLWSGEVPTSAGAVSFEFNLDKPAATSGGIYDPQGRLVRVLWTMLDAPAGKQIKEWDGKDDLGADAPAGQYSFLVLANRATYQNVGAIGNDGQPPDAKNHTPSNIESVAVDAEGAIYTANNWDEAGADFKKWTADGKSVYDAQYQIRNGQPNGAPYAIAVDATHIYCTMYGWNSPQWKQKAQVQKFTLKDGKHIKFTKVDDKAGHIQIYEFPGKQMPADAPKSEQNYYDCPLRALVAQGNSILVADFLGNRILRFDKETGEALGEFAVQRPQALAVDKKGQVWVGHQHHLVSVFSAEGKDGREALRVEEQAFGDGNELRKEVKSLVVAASQGEVEALAFDPAGHLLIADSAAGCVKIYDVSQEKPKPLDTLGKKAQPGDRAADRFFRLRGVAADKDGNIITIQTEPPYGGARLAKWSPKKELLWEHFGEEFVSLGNYAQDEPDLFYSMSFHRYQLKDRAAGTWDFIGNAFAGGVRYGSDVHGVPRILKLGQKRFYFHPSGDGVQVYRVDGKVLHLAAMLGGKDPAPDGTVRTATLGQWTWHDAGGTREVKPEDVLWFKKPGEGKYGCFGMDVDQEGNLWFSDLHTRGIWQIPIGPLDAQGNPTYDWANAKQAIARDQSPLKFEPNMAQRAADGSLYAFGWSAKWPQPKNNPFWMGGTTLARFDKTGACLWAVKLPATCVGFDVVPGGGCMVGSGQKASIYHYSAEGLLLGVLKPGEAMCKESGWMDNHASVAVNRDPRDGVLDVFAEDDYVLRIGWYRVNDKDVQRITGTVKKP
ncbi:MAG: FlgD immunoglobulin-like domain containing protein [Planctomycetota bacterium]